MTPAGGIHRFAEQAADSFACSQSQTATKSTQPRGVSVAQTFT
jgi:hypothetical protein